jgi:hypothetical protein
LTDQEPFGEDDYDELASQQGVSPEELVLGISIEFFRPLSPDFLKHIGDKQWQNTLQGWRQQ